MPTVIVTQSNGHVVSVRLVPSETTETTVEPVAVELAATSSEVEATTEVKTAPNPIAAEPKELAWAAGSFVVLFVILRYFLFPKLKKGMDARYADIRNDIDGAGSVKTAAQSDVAEYEKALLVVRAEAATRIDAARQTVDAERTAALAEVNARIAVARADAEEKTAAARAAAQGQVAAAVAQVATKAAELASGRTPDASVVQAAVASAMESAGSR